MGFSRYVAIGDSQTEGLWDGDDESGVVGFADRLAAMLDVHHPGLLYANLAIRGRRIRDLLDDQLPAALAMRPDLISVCIGMNDVTRPGPHFDEALAELDRLHAALAGSGATVLTTTFPDITRILPVGRFLGARVERINEAIRRAAEQHGFRLVDLYSADSMADAGTWSDDRVHGSSRGHQLFAGAAAEALALPGSSHDWAQRRTADLATSVESQVRSQLLWTRNMLAPWLWRYLRGRSIGDGRVPKRPRLQPVAG